METDATPEQFAAFVSETERRCPVTQLFKRSGLVFENVWTRAALREEPRAEAPVASQPSAP